MAKLLFKVSSDVDKVIKLREEVVKLKQEISTMSKGDASKTQKRINKATKELTSLVTQAAKAGQVFENDLKKKIFDTSRVVDTFSSKIINQKSVVRDVQADVRSLAEAYRNMSDININKGHTLKELQSARKVLDEEKASLFGLQQEQAKARLSVKGLKDEYSLLKDESKQVVNVNQGLAFSWKRMLGIIGGAAVLKKLSSDIVNVRGDMEALGNSFEVLLGSRKKAESFVSEIVDYAVATPFSTSNISGAAQTLLGFNVEAEKVMPTLKQIGDISMGNTQRFDSLALAFAQSSAAGRLLGQDLNQMINAGFNPLQIISEQTGKSLAELKKEMGEGGITSEMVAKAFEDATAEGGKFHGMLLKNADSVNTIRNQFEGAFEKMYNDLGTKGEGVIKFSYKAGISLVENYETVGKVIASSVAVLGTYKTALILNELIERRLAVTRLLAIKRQNMLNAAMNGNPYVLLATTIMGVVGAIWTFSNVTSAAEQAQRSYKKALDDINQKLADRKQKSEELISTIQDESSSDLDRVAAMDELKKAYPDIIQKYIDEKGHLRDILGFKREIAEIESNNRVGDKKELLKRYEVQYRKEEERLNSAVMGSSFYKTQKERVESTKSLYLQALDDVRKDEFYTWQIGLKTLTDKQIQTQIEENRRLLLETKNQEERDNLDKKYKVLESELKTRKVDSTYGEEYRAAQKEWIEAKKALEEIEKDKDKFFTKQHSDARERLDEADKAFKNLGGKTKETKSKKETADIDVQSQKREQEDLQFQLSQAKINAMKEGSEKVIAQIELNKEKEILALERNKEDYLKKKIAIEKSLSENEGKKFDASSVKLSVGENEMFDNLKEATNEKHSSQLPAVYADLLTKYQGYTEKRLSIQQKFQEDRENLVKARASKESLDENSYQETKALESIDNEFAMREESFQSWVNSIANIGIEELRRHLVEAKKELERMEFLTPNDPKLATQRAKVDKLESLTDKPEVKASPTKRSIKEWGDLYKVLGKVDKQFDEIGDTIGGTAGEILKSAGGIATATLQMVDGIMTLANSSSTAIKSTSEAASASIQTVEKASVVLAIIGAALQIATKIADMFGADYSKYERAKENYENYVEVLDQVIDKQKELIETMTGDAAVKASQKAIELIEKQTEAAKVLGKERLGAGASMGSHSIGIRQWKRIGGDLRETAKEIIGYDFFDGKRMYGLFDLSVEQMATLRKDSPEFWAKLDDDVRQYLDQIIAGNEKIEEMKELLNENLTQVSFDSLQSDYLDMLMNLDSSNLELAENFQEYLQKSILNSMLVSKYQGRLRGWYDQFARANEDKEGITRWEYDKLQDQWNKIAKDALKERDAMMDMFGWESEGKKQDASRGGFATMSVDQADSLDGRFTYNNVLLEQLKGETLSQTETMNYLKADLGEVLLTTKGTRDIADEIRTIQVNSYLELQEINEHTGNTVKELKKIAIDIQEVKRNTSKL